MSHDCVESRSKRTTKSFLIISILLLSGSGMTSCLAFPYPLGPYYKPTYPKELPDSRAWDSRAGSRVLQYIHSEPCFLWVVADSDQYGNLNITWNMRIYSKAGSIEDRCAQKGPLLFKDLETSKTRKFDTFHRKFHGPHPTMDIRQAADLVELIPGFAAVPKERRQYAIAISLRREFDGPFPEKVQIRIPNIQLGAEPIQLPSLRLRRDERSGNGWWYVLHSKREPHKIKDAGKSLGGGGNIVFKPADVLYEKPSLLRVSAAFRSYRRANSDQEDERSTIDGDVFFEVFGDYPLKISGSNTVWRFPGDQTDKIVSIDRSAWKIKKYTTMNLSERIVGFQSDWGTKEEPFEENSVTFSVIIRKNHPEKFKVKLPHVDMNGRQWPSHPIKFEYKSGGVGLWVYP